MNLPSPVTSEGRKALTFAALVGGAIVMTAFAAVGVYLVRNSAGLSFWLALAAHAQVALVLLSLGALLVKRSITATKEGLTYTDQGDAVVTTESSTEVKGA